MTSGVPPRPEAPASSPQAAPTRVLIVQRAFPAYRQPLFERLAASPRLTVTLAHGDPAPGSALANVEARAPLRRATIRNRYLMRGDRLVWSSGVLKQITRRRVDVVVAEFNLRVVSNLVACLWARLRGVRFVWWGHGFGDGARASPWVARVRVATARLANAVILYDEASADRYRDAGLASERVHVARNTMDTARIIDQRAAVYPDGRHRLLFVGRLVPSKRFDILLEAFTKARPRLPNGTVLTLVGDGPERDRVLRDAARLGVADAVKVVPGTFDETELARYFNTALAFVHPGPVGLAAIHTAAYGVPLVTCAGSGHGPELQALDGTAAAVVTALDASAFSDAVVALVLDEERAKSAHHAAVQAAESWQGMDAMVASFEQALIGTVPTQEVRA